MKLTTIALAVLLLPGMAAPCAGKSGAAATGRQGPAAAPSPRPAPTAAAASAGTATFGRSGIMSPYYRQVPEMDPNRKVSEQDCTRPIVFDGGNLRCR